MSYINIKMMKRLLFIAVLFVSVQSFGQFTKFYTFNEHLGVWADSISNIANRDTLTNPYKIGETRFRLADSTVYISVNTTGAKWMKLRGYVQTGIGTGTVQSVGASFPGSTAIGVSGSPVTGTGTLAFLWNGAGTDVVLGNGAYTPYNTLITGITNILYSPIGHSHPSSDITDLTPVVRNLFSGDSNINVNTTTGKISFTGATGGGGSDGNNYVNAASFSDNSLSLGRLGLSLLTASWDSTKYHSLGFYDARYQTQINGKEATFTETAQEFTGATSMSISLSNTPKTGKVEMYYLNGIVIKISNVSRTGTSVTLSGFTRESSDVITAKYSY